MRKSKTTGKLYIAIFTLLVIGGLHITSSFAQTPNTVRVEGVVIPIKSDAQQTISFKNSNFETTKFKLDSTLKFSGDIPLDKPDYFEMTGSMYNVSANCYLKPGINVKISIIEKGNKIWDIHFIDDGVTDINTYLIKKAQIIEGIEKSKGKDIYQLSGTEFLKTMCTIKTQVEALLEEMNLETEFTNTEKEKLVEEKLFRLQLFPSIAGFMGNTTQLPEDFYNDFLSYSLNIPYNNNKKSIIAKAFDLQALNMVKTKNISLFQAQKNIIDDIDFKETRSLMIQSMSRYALNKMPSSKDYLKYIVGSIDDKDFTNDLQSKYDSISSIKIDYGYPPLDSLKTINDEYVNLSDFKGKYVFLDLWASWCGPCRMQMPYLKKMEKEYHDKNIEFVSLSIDKPNAVDKWKQMVKDMQLGGAQLIIDHDKKKHTDFLLHFKVTGIPHFILFDPKGNVVHPDTPKPSDEALLKELFDTLKLN